MLNFTKLKSMLGDVAARRRELEGQIETLLQRREDLASLPLPKSDFLEFMSACIDDHKADYIERLERQINQHHENGHPLCLKPSKNWPVLAPWSGQVNVIVPGAILCLLGPEIKTRLAQLVGEMQWPDAGPPLAERRDELEKIDKEITKLEAELGEIRAFADPVGAELSGMAQVPGKRGKTLKQE